MAAKNPYDLDKRRDGPGRPHPSTTYTQEEQKEMLEGYLEIPARHWELLQYSRHVRYYAYDGQGRVAFRTGGFVVRSPYVELDAQGETIKFLQLQNGFGPKAFRWKIKYDDLVHVYAKPDAVTMAVRDEIEESLRGLVNNINILAKRMKQRPGQEAAPRPQGH
jgi:hypothetical protein